MPRPPLRFIKAAAALALVSAVVLPSVASAHADADVVAVAAGEQATVNFRPNHGCGASPTTDVAVRVPVTGAKGGDVDGWTWAAEEDGKGNTVVEWTGGSLPTDVTGAFPITFTVPDKPGELLLFPAVQTCENGEEWSWLNGDPESDNPVPRLLILAPGSQEATSIDEVPQDAAGRDLLTAVVNTEPTTTTTTAPPAEPTTTSPATVTTETNESTTKTTEQDAVSSDSDDGSGASSAVAWVLVGGVALIVGGGGLYLWRRESK